MVKPRSLEELEHVNPFHMSADERRIVHKHWTMEIRNGQFHQMNQLVCTHLKDIATITNVHDEVNLRCLAEADVIGVTTSGLARKLDVLQRLRCKVVICEKASEVLESHLQTALLPCVEHAIFIGYHLQLVPRFRATSSLEKIHEAASSTCLI